MQQYTPIIGAVLRYTCPQDRSYQGTMRTCGLTCPKPSRHSALGVAETETQHWFTYIDSAWPPIVDTYGPIRSILYIPSIRASIISST